MRIPAAILVLVMLSGSAARAEETQLEKVRLDNALLTARVESLERQLRDAEASRQACELTIRKVTGQHQGK